MCMSHLNGSKIYHLEVDPSLNAEITTLYGRMQPELKYL